MMGGSSMDWLLLILIGGSLFFTLMSNFKMARIEEQYQKQAKQALLEKEDWKSQWMAKDKAMHQILNEIQQQLKASIVEFQTIATQAIRKDLRALEQIFNRIQEQLESIKDQLQEDSHPSPAPPALIKQASEENHDRSSKFLSAILSRIDAFSPEEKQLVTKVFRTEASRWHKPSETGISETTSKLVFPLLGRKLIINGVPLIKIKDAGGSVKFIWGDGLADYEQKAIADYFDQEVKA